MLRPMLLVVLLSLLHPIVEAVRAGLIVKSEELKDSYSFVHEGWCPKRNNYYAAYLNLGSGIVYGEVKSFHYSCL